MKSVSVFFLEFYTLTIMLLIDDDHLHNSIRTILENLYNFFFTFNALCASITVIKPRKIIRIIFNAF